MRMLLGWRVQTEAYGGINADTRKALARTGSPQPEGRRLGVGAVLTRNWKGREIKVVVGESDQQAQVGCDSQIDFELEAGDEVRVNKLATPLKLLYPVDHSFFDSCRSKLDWASRLGGRQSG